VSGRQGGRAAAALSLGALIALGGGASVGASPVAGPPAAQAADCVTVYHKKRIVRRRVIHRDGRRIVRRRVRIKRWTTCVPVPPPSTTATPLGVLAYDAFDSICGGQEMCLQPTRSSVPAGPVTVEFSNHGEDPHTLRLSKAGGSDAPFAIPADLAADVPPAGVQRRTFTLTAGTWTLFCSLSGHEAAGMQAGLTVS
jgi:plastocyanin